MKKIILGCAAVLLSLGLLAGCNNKEDEPPIEEAVVITVDSSASVVVGESLALTYTVSPEKAEVVAASDNIDVVTAVAQSGTLYLEGVAEGSAIVTLVGTYEGYASANKNINVSVITKEEEVTEPSTPETGGEGGEDEQAVKLTIENTLSLTLPEQSDEAEPVKIEYTVEPTEEKGTIVDMVAADDESTIKLQNLTDGWYATPVAEGETTITVTAEYTSDEGVEYTPAEATIAVTVSEYTEPEPEPEPTTGVSGLVISIKLTLGETTPYVLPDWLDLYILGEWTCEELDSLDTATKLEYDEETQTYVTTISEELDIEGWYDYDLFAVYNTGITADTVSWDHKINDSHEYFQVPEESVTGDVVSKTYTLPEEFESEYPDPNASGTVEQQTNHKINFFFVDNAETPETYYGIPSYADGYLTGYFTSTWTDYSINGNTKLVANDSSDASQGYSVTIDTIYTGERTVNIYFEYNGTGVHAAATAASWDKSHSVFGDGDGKIVIDNTADADHSDVYLACNPSEIIVDDAAQTSVTLAINDTASTGTTLYCSGTMNEWNNSNTMTYSAGGTDYQYSYTFDVDEGSQLEFGIFNNSSWSDSLKVPSSTSEYWNNNNNIVIAGSVISGEKVFILFTADGTNFGTSTHVTATSVTIS